MIWTIEDLARSMVAQADDWRSVLYIGFGGGSALLGHSAPEALLNDFCTPVCSEFRNRDINHGWRNLDQNQRATTLRHHTTANSPEMGGISALARLIEERYFDAVVLTDPNKEFQKLLRQRGVDVWRFDCATQRPEVLATLWSHHDTRAICVDAADIILVGLEPSYFGLGDGAAPQDLENMRGALRTFAEGFNTTYVWDWCRYNVPFNRVWGGGRRNLRALGEYTDSAGLEEAVLVRDSGGGEYVDTRLFIELAECIFPDGSGETVSAVGEEKVRPGSIEEQVPESIRESRRMAGCLLWPNEVVASLHLQLIKPNVRLLVVGVSGSLVRAEVMSKLRASLNVTDHRFRRYAEFEMFRRSMSLLVDPVGPPRLLIEISSEDKEVPKDTLVSVASTWSNQLEQSGQRLLLLAPLKWSEVVGKVFSERSSVKCISLWPEECLTTVHLERWLSTLPLLNLARNKTVALNELAESMMRLLKEREWVVNGRRLDQVHEALDQWALIVDSGSAARDEGGLLDAEQLLVQWGQVLDRLHDDPGAVDFSLGDVRKRAESGVDVEFELGKIRQRPSEPGAV